MHCRRSIVMSVAVSMSLALAGACGAEAGESESGEQDGSGSAETGTSSSSQEGPESSADASAGEGGSQDGGEGGSAGSGSATGDGDGDGDGDGKTACEQSGGSWDEASCGHYVCGMAPTCEAMIPGCDCGTDQIFTPGTGCEDSAVCGAGTEAVLCVATGGTWDPLSCGHYVCGEVPTCQALDPGCDCGDGSNFDTTLGCAADPTCL